MFVVTFVWDENLKNPFQLIVIDLYITILGYFVNDLYKCLTCAFQWLSNEKKKHWKIISHIFYNLTWMSFYFIFHLFKMQYMWYTKTISIKLYACTIAQYTVKIVTNKRATKHYRNVDPSRTCINRQRQNTSKTHAKIWYVNIYLENFFAIFLSFYFGHGGGGFW